MQCLADQVAAVGWDVVVSFAEDLREVSMRFTGDTMDREG